MLGPTAGTRGSSLVPIFGLLHSELSVLGEGTGMTTPPRLPQGEIPPKSEIWVLLSKGGQTIYWEGEYQQTPQLVQAGGNMFCGKSMDSGARELWVMTTALVLLAL